MATDEIALIQRLSDMTKVWPTAILPQSKHASICQLHFPQAHPYQLAYCW